MHVCLACCSWGYDPLFTAFVPYPSLLSSPSWPYSLLPFVLGIQMSFLCCPGSFQAADWIFIGKAFWSIFILWLKTRTATSQRGMIFHMTCWHFCYVGVTQCIDTFLYNLIVLACSWTVISLVTCCCFCAWLSRGFPRCTYYLNIVKTSWTWSYDLVNLLLNHARYVMHYQDMIKLSNYIHCRIRKFCVLLM